jgi:hypothetical protein
MPLRTELNLRLPNSPGAVAHICRLLAAERVNIAAMSVEGNGQLRLVVDNRVRATDALRADNQQITERTVIVMSVPHEPGAIARELEAVAAAGFNVDYVYASTPDRAANSMVVLGLEDAERAAAAAGL